MKTLVQLLLLLALVVLSAGTGLCAPMSASFTFQGQLIQNGTPFNGSANLRFSLWDAQGGGTQIGASEIVAPVPVSNGLFVVQLNPSGQFGPTAFNGDARWLQIEVCTDAGCFASPTVLVPRQPVNATPYAQFSAGPWKLNGSDLYFSTGKVGIGTSSPATPLHVVGNATIGSAATNNTALTIPGPNSPTDLNSAQDIRYAFGSAGSARVRSYRGASWDTYLQLLTNSPNQGSDNPQPRMTIDGSGNVGIGTTSPVVKLDVMGPIYLGAGPRYSVPGAEEDLKMVRGDVLGNGGTQGGCCYFVTRAGVGVYDITYATSFSAVPSITVQPRSGGVLGATIVGSGPGSTPTAGGCRIILYQSGTLNTSDDEFYFYAIGPR